MSSMSKTGAFPNAKIFWSTEELYSIVHGVKTILILITSKKGAILLQGPHQDAVKSTTTSLAPALFSSACVRNKSRKLKSNESRYCC